MCLFLQVILTGGWGEKAERPQAPVARSPGTRCCAGIWKLAPYLKRGGTFLTRDDVRVAACPVAESCMRHVMVAMVVFDKHLGVRRGWFVAGGVIGRLAAAHVR